MISVRDIVKSYGEHRVLDRVSLEVAKGEVVCIIGPSGSGKSTLLRCINGLESYDEGQVSIDGEAVHREQPSIHAIRSEVGMVFQRFNLFPHRTACCFSTTDASSRRVLRNSYSPIRSTSAPAISCSGY